MLFYKNNVKSDNSSIVKKSKILLFVNQNSFNVAFPHANLGTTCFLSVPAPALGCNDFDFLTKNGEPESGKLNSKKHLYKTISYFEPISVTSASEFGKSAYTEQKINLGLKIRESDAYFESICKKAHAKKKMTT